MLETPETNVQFTDEQERQLEEWKRRLILLVFRWD